MWQCLSGYGPLLLSCTLQGEEGDEKSVASPPSPSSEDIEMAHPRDPYPSWSRAWPTTHRAHQRWTQLKINTSTLMTYDRPWNCYICQKQDLQFYHWTMCPCTDEGRYDQVTIDHVIPRSRGGSNTRDNMRPCCYPCNVAKGNKMPHNTPARAATLHMSSTGGPEQFRECAQCGVYSTDFTKTQGRKGASARCRLCVKMKT